MQRDATDAPQGTGFTTSPSSGRQLPVRPALDAHKSTLHMFYLSLSYHSFLRKESEFDGKILHFSEIYKSVGCDYNNPDCKFES